MSQPTEPDQEKPWPLPGAPVAWGVPSNLPATSIPLHKGVLKDGSLSKADYLSILADRVAWLISRSDSPPEAQRLLAAELERLGAWSGTNQFESPWDAVRQMLVDNPAWPDLLTSVVSLPKSPWPIRQIPAAVKAVQETQIEDWIAATLRSPSDQPEV